MNCLIIDHNKNTIKALSEMISRVDDLQVEGQYESAVEALAYLQVNHVDLLFIEIEMPQISGIELTRNLLNKNVVIIFTSANKDYAAEAFELNVADYLLKPIPQLRFLQAINRARDIIALQNMKADLSTDEYLFIKDSTIVRKLKMEDILYAEAMGDYVKFYTPSKLYAIHGTLNGAEERLPRSKFIRVHRSYIVCVNKIDTMQNGGVFINGQFLPVADAYKKILSKRMNIF
jgi:two-component system LytT family response regulator